MMMTMIMQVLLNDDDYVSCHTHVPDVLIECSMNSVCQF